MEHHPYWHVDREQMSSEETQLHEAAHGWFGNGVRLRCWEDFVLSEGTASYLAARALGVAAGPEAEAHTWARYRERLERIARRSDVFPDAWPRSCGAIDVLRDRLFSDVPYMKGAFFLRAVERRVGRDRMDAALRAFYMAHRGRAAGFGDLLETIRSVAGFDARPCADRLLGPEAREPMRCS
jgi:aminopeptidase N